jgi:hypothetical protein
MKPNTIALSVLTNDTRYIDLSKYTDDVTLTGYCRLDRLVFKNAKNKVLRLENATIETTHAEDALVFDGAENVVLHSDAESRIVGGAVTMWGDIQGIKLLNLNIMYAHTGIRYTQPTATANGIETQAQLHCPHRWRPLPRCEWSKCDDRGDHPHRLVRHLRRLATEKKASE